jgi:hypothetical protein
MRTKSLLSGCIILLVMVAGMTPPCFADNLIYGCVKNSGELLIVSGPGQCKANQTPISWPAGGGLTAVSGWIRADGVPELGDGFTSKYDSGVYYITFNQDFTGDPGCTISLLSTPTPTAFCSIIGVGPSILDVECVSYGISLGGTLVNPSNQVGFAFLCVGNVN